MNHINPYEAISHVQEIKKLFEQSGTAISTDAIYIGFCIMQCAEPEVKTLKYTSQYAIDPMEQDVRDNLGRFKQKTATASEFFAFIHNRQPTMLEARNMGVQLRRAGLVRRRSCGRIIYDFNA